MKNIDRLIQILAEERGEKVPQLSDGQKFDYFRVLVNVREPKPISDEFLRLQDEYLKDLSVKRGIVDANGLSYKDGIAVFKGDITTLNADAIVNACNSRLLGCFAPLHACIDNCIHTYAGVQVRLDCNNIMKGGEEPNGAVRVTGAYNLPSKYIFHTVGPIVRGRVSEQNERDLRSCYRTCLNKAIEMKLGSIAFCCLSTGVFGYPQDLACALAVKTVREVLKSSNGGIKVIFDVFLDTDEKLYEKELAIIRQRADKIKSPK